MNSTVLLCKNKVPNLAINMQPIPVSILFSLFIASSVVCNEQSPDFDLQSNVYGRHFLDTFKITSNVVSSVASNAGKGIGGVDAETKLGNAVISGINGVRKLADAGSSGDADAVESFANMTGDAVRAIGDIAAFQANMVTSVAQSLLGAKLGSAIGQGTNGLGNNSIKSAGAKGDSLSDEASIADQIVENAVKAAIGPAMKVSDNVDATFVAITYGASKAGEMASNGLKAASDAAGKAVGALTGAFSGLFG